MMVDILLDILCFVETLHKCLRVLFEFRRCARPLVRSAKTSMALIYEERVCRIFYILVSAKQHYSC